MAEKTINTRIALRIDTYENWTKDQPEDSVIGKNLVLKRGEIGFCEIPSSNTEVTTAPTVLFKVGDGTSKFHELKWASALAADVYGWAKSETVVLDGEVIKFKTGDTVNHTIDLSSFALDSQITNLQGDIADLAAEDTKLSGRIDTIEAKLGIEGEGKDLATQIADAVKEETDARVAADEALSARIGAASVPAVGEEGAEGYVPAKAATGVYVAIEKAQGEVDALEGEVAGVKGSLAGEVSARESADAAILTKIGTVAEGKDVVTMISDAQTAAENKVAELADGQVKTNKGDIATIKGDYLKAADKTALEGKIANVATAVETAKTELKGTATDTKDSETIVGAKKYADSVAAGVQGNLDIHINTYEEKVEELEDLISDNATAIANEKSRAEGKEAELNTAISTEVTDRTNAVSDLQTQINNIKTNITTGLHFRGVFNSKEEVENPQVGDICIVGTQEYIYCTKKAVIEGSEEETEVSVWEELGNAEAHATREELTTGLAGKVDKGIYEAKVADLEQADKDLEQAYKDADTALENKLTPLINGKVAQGDFNTLKGRVDSHDTAIAGKVDQSVYDTHLTTQAGINAGYEGRLDAIEEAIAVEEGKTIAGLIATAQAQADKGVEDAKAAQEDIDSLKEVLGTVEKVDDKTLVEQIAAIKTTADNAVDKDTYNAAISGINTALDGKVSTKGYIAYTQDEKDKLAGLSNYDDTALAGRVTALETADTNISKAISDETTRAEGVEAGLKTRLDAYDERFGSAADILVFNCGSATEVI